MSATIGVNVEYLAAPDRASIWGSNPDPDIILVHSKIHSLLDGTFAVPDKCRPEHFLYRAADHFGNDNQWRVATEISSATAKSCLNPIWFQSRPSPTNGQRYIPPDEASKFVDSGLSYYATSRIGEKLLVSEEGLGKPTWLTLTEIRTLQSRWGDALCTVSPQLQSVFAAIDVLEPSFGVDNVKLIFWHVSG